MFVGDLRLWEKRVYVCGLKTFHVCGQFNVSGWFYVCGKNRFTFVGKFYVYGRFTVDGVTRCITCDWRTMCVSPYVTLGLTYVRCVASSSDSSFPPVSKSCPQLTLTLRGIEDTPGLRSGVFQTFLQSKLKCRL